MFKKNYYCLVAGLREYTLDADTKGFDAVAIRSEILEELSRGDARQVRLLSGYYDCENLVALRAGRSAHNPLGNFSREELEAELAKPKLLPAAVQKVLRVYADPESEEAEGFDTTQRFERALFAAYYETCAKEGCRFMKAWAEFDRTLRNVAAAVTARGAGRPVEEVTVGRGEVVDQLRRSSAADFGLREEIPWLDGVVTTINDEANIVEKEHKLDLLRWNEAIELTAFDYFNIDAILSYLVRILIVARWSRLDATRGRAMFERLIADLDAREKIER